MHMLDSDDDENDGDHENDKDANDDNGRRDARS